MMLAFRLLLAAILPLFINVPIHVEAQTEVDTRIIERFKVGSNQRAFGPFIFHGGAVLSAKQKDFGGISAIRLDPNRRDFIAVTDHGFWIKGTLKRDTNECIIGVTSIELAPMRGLDGRVFSSKDYADAEGLEIKNGMIYVSFEHRARILGYPIGNFMSSKPSTQLDQVIPLYEFRRNGGMETLTKAPEHGPLKGAMITIAERSVNKDGALFAAILGGPEKGVFFIKRKAPFNITDADFLPNGDLVLLERRFDIASGVGMRLRLIKADHIKKNAVLDGAVLLDVDGGFNIDNMEGIDISENEKGQIFLTLISDNNFSFLQRNLILEFELKPDLLP